MSPPPIPVRIALTLLVMAYATSVAAQDRSLGTIPEMPRAPGTFNPTGPSPSTPPGAVAPMPRSPGTLNPTGPEPGAPPGYIHPMPQARGVLAPSGPRPQPRYPSTAPGARAGGELSPRPERVTRPGGKPPVGPGLENCLKGFDAKRGLSRSEQRALCYKIWGNRKQGSRDDD